MHRPPCPNSACTQQSQGSAITRHGFYRTRRGRRRRFRCLACGQTFSTRTNAAVFGLRCSYRTFERVARLSVEGVSRASIARVENVAWHTVDRWLTKASTLARRFNERHLHSVPLIELQADELRTFAPSKGKPLWVFASIEVCSRLWPSTIVGRRSYGSTKALFNDTLARGHTVGVPLITTDGFPFYERVIRAAFGVGCVYAQVLKTWRRHRIVNVERKTVIGTPRRLQKALDTSEDSTHANTAFIERLNLTLRQTVAYLRRRSPTHARCAERLRRQLDLASCHYNFIRKHSALRFGREVRTPAMVAGIRDQICNF